MEVTEIINDIDKCINELTELRETIIDDTERINTRWNHRQKKECYSIYGRVDGSKALIQRVRLYIHRRLIKYSRTDAQYDYMIRQVRQHAIDMKKPKEEL